MALIWPFGGKLTDSSGNALSGAKFRVYTANTTTLASLYSDAALTQAITNPVISQSDGMLANGGNECAVYVAAGTYDVAILSSADAVLDSVDDYIPWGSESGDLDRTVTGNGRFKVTGSAGTVLIQIGDPSPDNVGGTLIIEGQAGTQLDSLTLDSAAVNAGTSAGALKENSKKLIGVVQTEATTFTAAATVDIELTNSPTGVRAWEVELFDFIPSTTMQLQARLSFDSGGTYKSGAGEYQFSTLQYDSATNAYVTSVSTGAAQLDLSAPANGSTANRTGRVKVIIITPNSGNDHTLLEYTSSLWNTDGLTVNMTGAGNASTGNGRATHIRFLGSAGNITCKGLCRPLRGYGEA